MAIISKNEKGIALILTITLIGLIVIMILQFSKSIRTGLYETANFADGIQLDAVAKSGFNCALAALYEDDNNYDSLQDEWASLNQYSSFSSSLFDNDGSFQVEVTDLAGKIQINRLVNVTVGQKSEFNQDQYNLLTRLLRDPPFSVEPDQIKDILDAIKDWIDADDEVTGFGGAESSYYQSIDHPYSCRNAPMESLDELLLVKGITPDLYYGKGGARGLSAYLTVQGDGKININTADPVVLGALSEEFDDGLVKEIIEYRDNDKNDLSKPNWYKTAINTIEDYITPSSLITTKSSYFEIKSKGIKDTRSKEIMGIVKRQGKNLTVLSWRML
jgi:general secretion pathway protein K